MKIIIEVIPHSEQRYDTCGDWQFAENGDLTIKVSETGGMWMDFLIGRHEMDEAMLCLRFGVTEKMVDDYDLTHSEAGGDSFSENSDAPYAKFHNDALAAEWIMARLLGVDWNNYTKTLEMMEWNSKEEDDE